jgi:hypothetical protein
LPSPRGRRSGDGYLQARLQLVRQEYARVRGILTLTQKNSRQSAEWQQAAELLKEAGALLTARYPDARAAAATIAHADQSLVWCCDLLILRGRTRLLVDELESLGLSSKQLYQSAFLQAVGSDGQPAENWQELAMNVDNSIGLVAVHQQQDWINADLQVARLRLLVTYVGAALFLLLTASIIAVNPHPVRGWPVQELSGFPAPLAALVACTAVTVLGAAGGLFSALLSTQDASTTLLGYRTSVMRLGLKPLGGALVACVLYMMLSWQVVPGITVNNGGTFLVVGFAVGFSERYILKLLNVPDSADQPADEQPDEAKSLKDRKSSELGKTTPPA